jgi:cell division protein FtsX
MVQIDPLFVALTLFLFGIVFFFFLMIRRTLLGFKEGVERGRD